MNEEKFWSLIESCARKDHDLSSISVVEHYNSFSASLGHLSQPDLDEFVSIFYRLREQARSSQIAQAAFILAHGEIVDDSVNVFLTGVIMHGREFYLRCLEKPESTLLSMECPQELQMYAPIYSAFEDLQQNRCGNSGISSASCADDLSLIRNGIQVNLCTEDLVRQEMPRLFKKYWC